MKKQFTDEQWEIAHDYLMNWYETDGMRDINLALDSGDTVSALNIIVSAGACEGICERSKLCLELHKSLSRDEIDAACEDTFGNAVIYEDNYGSLQFVKNQYVDYLIDHDEALSWGWKKVR